MTFLLYALLWKLWLAITAKSVICDLFLQTREQVTSTSVSCNLYSSWNQYVTYSYKPQNKSQVQVFHFTCKVTAIHMWPAPTNQGTSRKYSSLMTPINLFIQVWYSMYWVQKTHPLLLMQNIVQSRGLQGQSSLKPPPPINLHIQKTHPLLLMQTTVLNRGQWTLPFGMMHLSIGGITVCKDTAPWLP